MQSADAFLDEFMRKRIGHAMRGPEIAAWVGIPSERGNVPTMMDVPGVPKNEYVGAYGWFRLPNPTSDKTHRSWRPTRGDTGHQIAIPAHPSFDRERTLQADPELMKDRYGKPIPEGYMPGLPQGYEYTGPLRTDLPGDPPPAGPSSYPSSTAAPIDPATQQIIDRYSKPLSPTRTPNPANNPFAGEPKEYQDLMRRLGVIP